MIKSGLVNQKRGGGFEQGYPSQKYPRGRDEFIRPYVDNSDPTILRKSEYSDPMAYKAITPSPVQYNDIFRKKPTPDERLYILKQIQQGLDKVQKGILGKIPGAPTVAVPSATAPSATQPSDEIGQTIGAPPSGGSGGEGIPIDDLPPLSASTGASSEGVPIADDDETVPQVSGETFDSKQQDGVDEVQAERYSDEITAVPLTMPAAVDPVTEDVVGPRTGNADTETPVVAPGKFPTEEESKAEPEKESKDEMTEYEKQQAGMLRDKPRTDFYPKKSKKERLRLWHAQFDRVQKARAKHGKPAMSSTSTPFKMSPMTGRGPSK